MKTCLAHGRRLGIGLACAVARAVLALPRRETHPAELYPSGGAGGVGLFDDLWPVTRASVDTTRPTSDAPALAETDVTALAAFLRAPTDGSQP